MHTSRPVMKTSHFSPWTLYYCPFCYLSWIQFELVHENSIPIRQSTPNTVFSRSLASEFAPIQMQSPLAQRSSANKQISSDKVQDYSHLKDTDGMTAHFPGLLFITAWRLCSCDSLHIAFRARVPGRECRLLALSSRLSPQQSTQLSSSPNLDIQLQERVWSKSHPLLSDGQTHPIATGYSHASNTYRCTLDHFLLEVCTKQPGANPQSRRELKTPLKCTPLILARADRSAETQSIILFPKDCKTEWELLSTPRLVNYKGNNLQLHNSF